MKLVYQDNSLSFAELLEKGNSVTIHQRNLEVLATEIFKLKSGLVPEIRKEVFKIQNPAYNFRSEDEDDSLWHSFDKVFRTKNLGYGTKQYKEL